MRGFTRVGSIVLLALAGCAARAPLSDLRAFADARAAADVAYARHDWRGAVTHYEQALSAAPGDAQAWLYLGNAQARLGATSDAETAYRQALVRDRGNAKAWFNLGVLLLRDARQAFAEAERTATAGDVVGANAARVRAHLIALGAGETTADTTGAAVPGDGVDRRGDE